MFFASPDNLPNVLLAGLHSKQTIFINFKMNLAEVFSVKIKTLIRLNKLETWNICKI